MTTPSLLINTNGQPSYGVFPHSIERINYMDFDLRTPMDRKLGNLAKRIKFNQFQFIGLISPELIVGIAIVDLKIASNCFVYLYEPKSQQFDEFSFIQPLAMRTQIDPLPNDGQACFHKGKNRVCFKADSQTGTREVQVRLAKGISINATLDENNNYNPLAVCSRAGYQGWVFTQKSNALNCKGQVQWKNKTYDLESIQALASVDWSCGFMRRETFWNWGSLSCTLRDGRRLGFNLAAGVNETGTSENALWLNGKLIKVDMVDFQFDRYQPNTPWEMHSNDGIIQLRFEPKGQRKEKMNALIAASNFTQHFGQYYGEIHLPDEIITLNGEWGFCEDHYAKW
ncbi:DUF2804 domain-containing protein [Bacterioplanoides sp.]|uniref:DUF2804 domain-containing protein n=1 Tax=Bacterioplanoides sp. TaxID=2066072 RepID=UPI003B00ED9D